MRACDLRDQLGGLRRREGVGVVAPRHRGTGQRGFTRGRRGRCRGEDVGAFVRSRRPAGRGAGAAGGAPVSLPGACWEWDLGTAVREAAGLCPRPQRGARSRGPAGAWAAAPDCGSESPVTCGLAVVHCPFAGLPEGHAGSGVGRAWGPCEGSVSRPSAGAQCSCDTPLAPATGDGRWPSQLRGEEQETDAPDVPHGPEKERRPLVAMAVRETSSCGSASR